MRSPGATSKARVAVGVEQQDLQLAAVARVDQAGGVDERDAVACGEPERGRTRPAWPRRQLDRDPGADLRALAGLEASPASSA